MPNQRDKDKKFVGAWLKTKLHARVTRRAKDEGLSVTEFVTDLLTHAANDPGAVSVLSDAAPAEISSVAPKPQPVPVIYGSPKKVVRLSKVPRVGGSKKKA
jgi:alpha/beta superfamily hydrolase